MVGNDMLAEGGRGHYRRQMQSVGDHGTSVQQVVDEDLDSGEAFDHLVCCRGSWEVAVCGADTSLDPIVMFSELICTLCAEIVQDKYRAMGIADFPVDDPICFETGRPCPTGEERDQMWRRVLSRPEKLEPTD